MTGAVRARALFLVLPVALIATVLAGGVGAAQTGGRGAAPAGSIVVPVEHVSGVFFARVSLNGKGPFWFTVDTGATHTVIDPATARRLGLKVVDEGGSLSVGIGPGTTPIATTQGVSFRVGGARPFAPRRVWRRAACVACADVSPTNSAAFEARQNLLDLIFCDLEGRSRLAVAVPHAWPA